MCQTYILYSREIDTYYVGHTCDHLEERLRKHLSDHKGFTGKAKDWKILFHQRTETKAQAYALEMRIKKRKSRTY
ncbi:MAG: GIY-YIG nuclease family protein, partial [Maribacter sp.]